MQDAANTLKLMYELNVLPLALQITCIAGKFVFQLYYYNYSFCTFGVFSIISNSISRDRDWNYYKTVTEDCYYFIVIALDSQNLQYTEEHHDANDCIP